MEDIEILILDDDEAEWEFIKHALDVKGVRNYFFFSKSSELVKKLNTAGQVIVLDYRLPGDININGYEVMLISKDKCNSCYFIVVTGGTLSDVDVKLINAKADLFLIKTTDYATELAEVIITGREEVAKRIISEAENVKITDSLKEKVEGINQIIQKLDKNESGANP